MECETKIGENTNKGFAIVSLLITIYIMLSEILHRVLHHNDLLDCRIDAKVKAFVVAQLSRRAGLAATAVFSVLNIISTFHGNSIIMAYLFYISFLLHVWFQTFYVFFKHDVVKFDKIAKFSRSWYVLIIHRVNLVVSLCDILLAKVSIENDVYYFTFKPYIHIPLYISSQIIGLSCFGLLLSQYIELMTRHCGRRYNIRLTSIFWRNATWGLVFNLIIILSWNVVTLCSGTPISTLSMLLSFSSFFILLTYGDRLLILCPLLFTLNKINLLPEDRRSIRHTADVLQKENPGEGPALEMDIAIRRYKDEMNRLSVCRDVGVIEMHRKTLSSKSFNTAKKESKFQSDHLKLPPFSDSMQDVGNLLKVPPGRISTLEIKRRQSLNPVVPRSPTVALKGYHSDNSQGSQGSQVSFATESNLSDRQSRHSPVSKGSLLPIINEEGENEL